MSLFELLAVSKISISPKAVKAQGLNLKTVRLIILEYIEGRRSQSVTFSTRRKNKKRKQKTVTGSV
jgi:hypothetical protein